MGHFIRFEKLYGGGWVDGPRPNLNDINTGCPKTKLALGKHLEIAIHGFKMCILHVKREKLGSNPLKP